MAGGPSTPELAAAVAGAGGFGFVAAAYLSVDALHDALTATRALTDAPLGVNFFVPGNPSPAAPIAAYAETLRDEAERLGAQLGEPRWEDDEFDAKVDRVLEFDLSLVTFTFGCPPAGVLRRFAERGVTTGVTVTSRDEAQTAARAGADVLVVQGTEAGGHQGTFDPAEPNRTPLVDALRAIAPAGLPMIAAGGIMSGADAAAALQAGAVAVQIGTALLCTPEANTNAPHRAALLDHRYDDTVVTRAFSGRWARGLRNRFAIEHDGAPAGYPEVHHLTRPLRAAAVAAGDADVPNLWAGTGWRAVRSEPAAAVVERIAAELAAAR